MSGEMLDERAYFPDGMPFYGDSKEAARLYDEAVRDGVRIDLSLDEFLVLPAGLQKVTLMRAYGGDGGIGYDKKKHTPAD